MVSILNGWAVPMLLPKCIWSIYGHIVRFVFAAFYILNWQKPVAFEGFIRENYGMIEYDVIILIIIIVNYLILLN